MFCKMPSQPINVRQFIACFVQLIVQNTVYLNNFLRQFIVYLSFEFNFVWFKATNSAT